MTAPPDRPARLHASIVGDVVAASVPLETMYNVARLHTLAVAERPAGLGTVWVDRIGRLLDGETEQTIAGADLVALRADCDHLRDLVSRRGAVALGAVDVTSDGTTNGLAEAWSVGADGTPSTVARLGELEVAAGREGFLLAHRASPPATLRVDEVVVDTGTTEVLSDGETHLLDRNEAALLRSVVDSSHYRVRRVPEVVVWSTTFARLPEMCLDAVGDDCDVVLTVSGGTNT